MSFPPKKKKSPATINPVTTLDLMMVVMKAPKMVDSTVITARAPYDPMKTTIWLYFMAMTIARKNVLSPISHTRMVKKESKKAVPLECSFTV